LLLGDNLVSRPHQLIIAPHVSGSVLACLHPNIPVPQQHVTPTLQVYPALTPLQACIFPYRPRALLRRHESVLTDLNAALSSFPRPHYSMPLSPEQHTSHPEATMPPHPYNTIFPRHVPKSPALPICFVPRSFFPHFRLAIAAPPRSLSPYQRLAPRPRCCSSLHPTRPHPHALSLHSSPSLASVRCPMRLSRARTPA
jgi:hypothetical protein